MRVYTRALKQIPESCEFTLVLLCGKDIPHGLLMSVKHNILINQGKKKKKRASIWLNINISVDIWLSH